MIFILSLLIVFVMLSVVLWLKGKRKWASLATLPVVLILWGIGYFVDYYSPRHWIEIKLPIDLSDAQFNQTVEFELPQKEYILTTTLKDGHYEKENAALLKYTLEIPAQDLKIENETKTDFLYGSRENRMESFKIEKNNSKGRLSAQITRAGSGNIYLVVRTNRTLDM